eukprot:CAMPEP_0196774364 /NCGR_PEP_ID=MMETSP1104-20130614/3351_1 /TAXON_ID=33652 /ORGANISM="Cafeteria sp., Strain Caron Lab Isolate" /LENGTH=587 /DNA_ID=CAMNT_0042144519 /DNA_START=66 /DNA_END=1826 /DNA_ORIENTATION=+
MRMPTRWWRPWSLVMLVLVGTTVSGSTEQPANLLENPSFEHTWSRAGSDEHLVTGWQLFLAEYPHRPDPPFGRTGSSCFVVRHDGGEFSSWRGFGQSVFVTHDESALELHLEAYIAGYRLAGPAAIAMDIEFVDGTFLMDQAAHSKVGTFGWQKLEVNVPASKPIRTIFVFGVSESLTQSAAFFDDFSLTARPVPKGSTPADSRLPCPPSHACWGSVALPVEPDFIKRARTDFPHDGITLCTQMTVDRTHLLPHISRNWGGPMSVVIFVREEKEDLVALQKLAASSQSVQDWISVHLVHNVTAMFDYPINLLRNVAWEFAPTDLVFNVDADFVPGPGAQDSLVRTWRSLVGDAEAAESPYDPEKLALVVPAFEFRPDYKPKRYTVQAGDTLSAIAESHGMKVEVIMAMNAISNPDQISAGQHIYVNDVTRGGADETHLVPASKAALLDLLRRHRAQPVHKDKFFEAHRNTRYGQWRAAEAPYVAQPGPSYEPYMVVDRRAPHYCPRFVGYGLDKVSHSHELGLVPGFKLMVEPTTFVMHINHGVADWAHPHTQNRTRVYASWYGFIYSSERQYGGGEFYTGPSLLSE